MWNARGPPVGFVAKEEDECRRAVRTMTMSSRCGRRRSRYGSQRQRGREAEGKGVARE